MWWVAFKMACNDPGLLMFTPVCNQLFLNMSWTWQLVSNEHIRCLMNTWDVTSELGYKNTLASILCSPFVHLLEGSQLPYQELYHKKAHMAGKFEKLLANSLSKPEDLSLIVHEELNTAKNHVTLEVEHYPVKPSHETTALADILNAALGETLKQKYPAKPYLDS